MQFDAAKTSDQVQNKTAKRNYYTAAS